MDLTVAASKDMFDVSQNFIFHKNLESDSTFVQNNMMIPIVWSNENFENYGAYGIDQSKKDPEKASSDTDDFAVGGWTVIGEMPRLMHLETIAKSTTIKELRVIFNDWVMAGTRHRKIKMCDIFRG